MKQEGFAPSIIPSLDLVEEDDQITFELSLDEEGIEKEDHLDVFRYDADFDKNELIWKKITDKILGNDNSSDNDSTASSSLSEDEVQTTQTELKIEDLTETTLINLRRTIYLTIMSSASFEKCTYKLSKVAQSQIPIGAEHELINMIIECCSQERTYLKYYGILERMILILPKKDLRKALQRMMIYLLHLKRNPKVIIRRRNIVDVLIHLRVVMVVVNIEKTAT